MQHHEQSFYEYQTIARGRRTRAALEKEFASSAPWYRRRLRGLLPAERDAPILDCPCGYGNILWFLRGEGYTSVEGIDLDPRQVALARQLELPAREGDAMDHLRDHSASYAAILSVDFLEHLDKSSAVRWLELVHAALRPGGVFIARTPCADGPFGAAHRYNDITHQWAMTAVCARGLLGMCGFDRVQILDERPQMTGRGLHDLRRVIAFGAARFVARRAAKALTGGVPEVWTRSMWIVGERAERVESRK